MPFEFHGEVVFKLLVIFGNFGFSVISMLSMATVRFIRLLLFGWELGTPSVPRLMRFPGLSHPRCRSRLSQTSRLPPHLCLPRVPRSRLPPHRLWPLPPASWRTSSSSGSGDPCGPGSASSLGFCVLRSGPRVRLLSIRSSSCKLSGAGSLRRNAPSGRKQGICPGRPPLGHSGCLAPPPL